MLKFLLLGLFLVAAVGLLWTSDHKQEAHVRPVISELASEVASFPPEELATQDEQDFITENDALVIRVKFFYEQLDEEERMIYRVLRDGVALGETEIQVYSDDTQRLFEIYRMIHFDYPEFFWMTGWGKMTTYQWPGGRVYTVFEPEYGHVGEEKERMQAEIEAAVEAFLATVDANATEFERVRAVYEYIIMTTTYNLDAPDNQNIYSVFVHRESVCAGFSRAAQLLLERLGIFATYVVGDAYIPGFTAYPVAHAWNLVRVDGEYYYLDVTWGSPTFAEDFILADSIHILYDYLLVNEEQLFRTHTLGEGINMPPVTSTRSNFFYVHGMFYHTHDPEAVLEAMNASILDQEDWIAFQFATPELFQSMRPVIYEELAPIAARNLMEWYGLDRVQYFFREKENLNKITIHWLYE